MITPVLVDRHLAHIDASRPRGLHDPPDIAVLEGMNPVRHWNTRPLIIWFLRTLARADTEGKFFRYYNGL